MIPTAAERSCGQDRQTMGLTLKCPICDKEFFIERREDAPFRPFCTRRCKLIDLGRWLDGTYSISEPLAQNEPSQPTQPTFPTDSMADGED